MNAFAAIFFFIFVYDSAPARHHHLYGGPGAAAGAGVKCCCPRPRGGQCGRRLAGIVVILIIIIYGFRMVGPRGHRGELHLHAVNQLQSALILALVFLSMALNFGFLLMAIDRLRNEVADLALMDDSPASATAGICCSG